MVPLLSRSHIDALPPRAREVVEYRKSDLSLNHIQGCPLDCAYCIRHTYGLWDQRVPRALMSDAEAVQQLVRHRYFQPQVTPLQIFNRATDPFLPAVRPHTLAVLSDLDSRGLRNHVLVITRHQMKREDIARLNELASIRLTLLFTYSGIDDKRIEPYPSRVAAGSLQLMSAPSPRRYRKPELVELAVVPIAGGVIGEPVSWLVPPPRPITAMASRIHGLEDSDVAAAPVFLAVEAEVQKALAADVLVAHNAAVDVSVLRRYLTGWQCPEILDTLKAARRLLPGQASYKLGALTAALSLADGLPAGLSPHRATYDALVTARLFIHLATSSGDSLLPAGSAGSGGDANAARLF